MSAVASRDLSPVEERLNVATEPQLLPSSNEVSWSSKQWGTTESERAQPFPCDEFVSGPRHASYHRAVTVEAPKELVFRWLCQLKVAPYAYDWLDNLGRQSPREL